MVLPVRFKHIKRCRYYIDRRLDRDRSDLKESLLDHGVLQAPIGRLVDENDSPIEPYDSQGAMEAWFGKHPDRHVELAAGHRRVWSVKELAEVGRGRFEGESSIGITIKKLSDKELAAVFHQENAERDNVSPVLEAEQWAGMLKDGMSQTEVAEFSGTSRSTIHRRTQLMNFPERVRKEIDSEESDLGISAATTIADVWDLSAEEEEALVRKHDGVRGPRLDLLDTARKETLDTLKQEKKRLIDDPIEDYQTPQVSGTENGREDSAPEDQPAETGGDSSEDTGDESPQEGAGENGAVQVHVEGDLTPGEYVIRAAEQNGESKKNVEITEEQKRAAGMLATQLVNVGVDDLIDLVSISLGTESSAHAVKVVLITEYIRRSDKDWESAIDDLSSRLDFTIMQDPLTDG